jgi:hypothetical protein
MTGLSYLLFAIVMTAALVSSAAAENKQIMGWMEKALLLPENLVVRAKLDTGADHSSLNVPTMAEFERDGERWIRFSVTNHNGESSAFERPVIRVAKIKRHGEIRQERPVVLMGICLGRCLKEVEVNLVDRSGFKCQLLVGRSFMRGDIVVDPSVEYAADPQCSEPEAP